MWVLFQIIAYDAVYLPNLRVFKNYYMISFGADGIFM